MRNNFEVGDTVYFNFGCGAFEDPLKSIVSRKEIYSFANYNPETKKKSKTQKTKIWIWRFGHHSIVKFPLYASSDEAWEARDKANIKANMKKILKDLINKKIEDDGNAEIGLVAAFEPKKGVKNEKSV